MPRFVSATACTADAPVSFFCALSCRIALFVLDFVLDMQAILARNSLENIVSWKLLYLQFVIELLLLGFC